MTRQEATKFLREELNKYNLTDWHIRLNNNLEGRNVFLGLCSYKDKCIILNSHHIEIHPDPEVVNTIRHEVAHALTPGMGHNETWRAKAIEVGCTNTAPCSHLFLDPTIIDAIRSGADVQVEFETEVIHHPKYKISRLQELCPFCNKVAIEKFVAETFDNEGNKVKLITYECFHVVRKVIPRGTPFEDFITYEHRGNNCIHNWDKNHCVKCNAYRLYDFQVVGARFLEIALATKKGGGLLDDMGLGKTVQALAYLNFHEEKFPVLFIVKSGIKFQFFKEIIRWLGPKYAAQVISTSRDYILPGLKCYIVSYDLLRFFPIEKIHAIGIKTVILDEVQQIKNPDSARTKEVRKLVKDAQVIPMSGTPWKNRGSEFFVCLNMLDPTRFQSYQGFMQRWVDTYYHGDKLKIGGIRNPEKFREFVSDIIIRRERIEVMKELPVVTRNMLYWELDKISQGAYEEGLADFVAWYNNKVIGGEEDSFETQTNMLAKLARLRHITGLAKIPATLAFTEEFFEDTDRKLVIFVHHRDVGQLIHNAINEKLSEWNNGIKLFQLTSEKTPEERFTIQEEFNKSPRAVLVASTLASGEGLNLQTCADCIMHERQWNPANEEQAEARFIRIGQVANAVNATYITAAGSVDEHLNGIIETKRIQFHLAMNKGEMAKWNQGDIVKELAENLVRDYMNKMKGRVA